MMKMKNVIIGGIFAATLAFSGCKSANKAEEEGAGAGGVNQGELNGGSDDNTMGDSDSGKAMGMKTVYFTYDSSDLDAEGKAALTGNAEILKSKANVKIQIEGHCDQRGGIQYNMALGEKRAMVVKNWLKNNGVSADRIATISYGKEKPVDPAMNESAFSKNRRANFAITTR